MDSTSDTNLSAPQSLKSNLVNNPDSTEPLSIPDQIQPFDPQSAEDVNQGGEKRKREDDEKDIRQTGSETEVISDATLKPLWKSSLCSYFRRNAGFCRHGSTCRYAHGEEELRPRPDNTWDPTSERAKKMMKTENGEKCGVEEEKTDDVLMTEMVIDDDNGGEDCFLDTALSKCLVHLPRKWDSDHLRKFLGEEEVHFKHAKKKKGMSVGFVRFESAEQLENSMKALDGKSAGSKNIKVADVIPRSYDDKIKSAMALPCRAEQDGEPVLAGNVNGDGLADDGSVPKGRSVCDVVTPLAYMSYSEQLEHKKTSLTKMLKKLTKNTRKACPDRVSLPEWILNSREIGGLPCKLEGIIESPLVNGYRNKCEFSVGYSVQGKATVGFMLGNFREGVTAVQEPSQCKNVSVIASKYAAIFQEFLQQSSFPIWNRFKNVGFWRQLTVREGRKPGEITNTENPEANVSEVMLIVQVCSVGFDDSQITTEFERMAEAFVDGARTSSPSLPLTVLVVQDHQGISNAAPADCPLRSLHVPTSGSSADQETTSAVVEARIHDYISNLQFSISPTAFFQVNTLAAEKLYSLAGDWASLGPDTLLFDICCGTGTIGLTLAHRVGMVIGIEMNASAVSDANRNAEINGINNCKFVCSKAEDVMGSLLKEYLNVPTKQDDMSNFIGDKEISTPEEKSSISVENASDAKQDSCNKGENGESAADGSVNGEEVRSQHQNNCTSEDGKSSAPPQFKNVVAIVDPPRVGLHPIVIKALRTHPGLRRLVYISCNPESLVANAIELCTPSPDHVEKVTKNNRGWRNMSSAGLARHRSKSMPISEPFRPVKAMAVDLFPHTPHCELVMLLER